MPTVDPNESAFPYEFEQSDRYRGVTIREYFAAVAMQGLLSDADTLRAIYVSVNGKEAERSPLIDYRAIALGAVACADALIAELGKT